MRYVIEQNTDEWFELRLGVATASNFAKIMANDGKAFGNPATEYAERLALERVTNKRIPTYKNEYMERGNELEPQARERYEAEYFCQVQDGGFFKEGWVGCSPDGLLDDGGIEIKSVIYSTHFERLRKGGYDLKYKWQIQGNIWLADLQWMDFVQYCPEFPFDKQLYIFRVERDEEIISKLTARIENFLELIEENVKLLEK